MTHNLTADFVRSILDYDQMNGQFTWRRRDDVPQTWNTKFAGKGAGGASGHGYRTLRIKNVSYYLHRLAFLHMTGRWPIGIDHINGDKSDNRWANLREAAQFQNQANSTRPSRNKTGRIGVSWDKKNNRWRADIRVRGKSMNLGRYGTFEEAVAAREAAESHHQGEFAYAQRAALQ